MRRFTFLKSLSIAALIVGSTPAFAQVAAPTIKQGNSITTAQGVFGVDSGGGDLSDPTNHALRIECISAGCTINQGTGNSASPWYVQGLSGYPLYTIITSPSGNQATVSSAGHFQVDAAITNSTLAVTQSGTWGVSATQSGSWTFTNSAGFSGWNSYTSGVSSDMRSYANIYFLCTTGPSAGTISISPDNNSDFVAQTVVLNTSSGGITTTSTISAQGLYSLGGHVWFQATLTGGTCWIAGGA